MSDIPWDHEARLLHSTPMGERIEERGTVRMLVDHFLRTPEEQRRGLVIRISGTDWTRELDEAAIHELMAEDESLN